MLTKEEKSAYDREYRAKNKEKLRIQKAAYHKRTYNVEKAAIKRKETMARHVEYCRRTEYRKKKADYDRKYRASVYGNFSDAFLLLVELEKEIRSRQTAYERRKANGYYTRNAQSRRRQLWEMIRRN